MERTDDGFTMIEMIVALVIIGIIMAALATFFVSTVKATAQQGTKQAAIQLADDAIERARALKGSAVVDDRDQFTTDAQWGAAPTVVANSYLNTMDEAVDPTAVKNDGLDGPAADGRNAEHRQQPRLHAELVRRHVLAAAGWWRLRQENRYLG